MKSKRILLMCLIVLLTLVAYGEANAQFGPRPRAKDHRLTVDPVADGPALNAAEIYATTSPAIAFIETPVATGSGVLVEHNYLLTNAHVVQPYRAVRVVFSDGSEFEDVPVYGWDMMTDLALLGPIDTTIEPLALADGSDMTIGSNVYLVGYPAEVEELPHPTITSGILSRVRRWDTLDLSLFQADAAITGGQSGGVLVNEQGDVIGISTFEWDDFALSTSVVDALPRLQAILDRDYNETLGSRRISFDSRATYLVNDLYDAWDERTFMLNPTAGDEVELLVDGPGFPYFSVMDEYGTPIVDSLAKGETAEVAMFTAMESIPYYVQVQQYSDDLNPFELTSSHPIVAVLDADDGVELERGQTLTANLDTPMDYDVFYVYFHTNELVEIEIDSLGLDVGLWLEFYSNTWEEYVYSEYSDGIFGHNNKIVYRAPSGGLQRITVFQYRDSPALGGYFLSFDSAPLGATPTIIDSERELLDTPSGMMARYESEYHDFEMLYPGDWVVADVEDCLSGDATFCAEGAYGRLYISEEDLTYDLSAVETLGDYVDYALEYQEFDAPGFELISREPYTTVQGLPGELVIFETDAGQQNGVGFYFLDEASQVVFDATYVVDIVEFDWLLPMFVESIDSFRSWAGRDPQDDPIRFLDEGVRYLASGNPIGARTALNKAIDLDPALAEAYLARARVHFALNDLESLEADLAQAMALEPDNIKLFYDAADLLYRSFEYDDAYEIVTKALALDPLEPYGNTLRAKIAAFLGRNDQALTDLSMTEFSSDSSIVIDGQITRGFVYLLEEQFKQAQANFDELYIWDWHTPQVLLGLGIANAELAETETEIEIANDLLNEGIQRALDPGVDPDPLLDVLYEMAKEVLN